MHGILVLVVSSEETPGQVLRAEGGAQETEETGDDFNDRLSRFSDVRFSD